MFHVNLSGCTGKICRYVIKQQLVDKTSSRMLVKTICIRTCVSEHVFHIRTFPLLSALPNPEVVLSIFLNIILWFSWTIGIHRISLKLKFTSHFSWLGIGPQFPIKSIFVLYFRMDQNDTVDGEYLVSHFCRVYSHPRWWAGFLNHQQ